VTARSRRGINDECRDLIVKLYDLPDSAALQQRLRGEGIAFRRALAPEKHLVLEWMGRNFWRSWVSECDVAFSRQPIACMLAVSGQDLLGVAVYDSLALGVAGPLAIRESRRRSRLGLGGALALQMFEAMRAQGYAYAVLGCMAPGPRRWINKTVKAQVIEDSQPLIGMYRGLIVEE